MREVCYGVEGVTDEPVARHLISFVGRTPRAISVDGGKSALDAKLRGRWNSQTNKLPILVLRDWDDSDGATCIVEHLDRVVGGPLLAPNLVLRVPVRSIEAWLMADAEGFKSYFQVSKVPLAPDSEPNPKATMVGLCARSRSSVIRRDMAPRPNSGRPVGPQFTTRVIEFGTESWSLERAMNRSPSLARAVVRLQGAVDADRW